MSYDSKSKTELAKIGAEGFAVLDDFNPRYGSSSTVSAPPNQAPSMFHRYKHRPQQPYLVRQQVYATQVQTTRVETVVDCYEAAKKYGGTVVVDYAKRKSTRWGFF
ncbi:hypothetical protein QVD17_01758 [Tagetes erecta]|uniref:Uncharacterized protein n=1 Tax=Tagetes erecta TaxID=13708 RepID=A0AAD8L822_TARER|nr:hypothetical protein QVD17_01758 [Tagetes erecta]